MAFFLSMSSEKKKRGEWEVFKPQPGAFARFLYLVSFFALDLIPKQQAKVLSGIVSHKVKK